MRRTSYEDEQKIIACRKRGWSYGKIAEKFGFAKGSIPGICKRHGLQTSQTGMKTVHTLHRDPTRRKQRNAARGKYIEDDEIKVYNMVRKGMTYREMKAKTGLAFSTLHYLRRCREIRLEERDRYYNMKKWKEYDEQQASKKEGTS